MRLRLIYIKKFINNHKKKFLFKKVMYNDNIVKESEQSNAINFFKPVTKVNRSKTL
jgi:hypothetical protein